LPEDRRERGDAAAKSAAGDQPRVLRCAGQQILMHAGTSASTPFVTSPVLPAEPAHQRLLREHLRGIPFNWTPEWVSGPVLLAPAAYEEICSVAVRSVKILEKSFLSLGSSFSKRARRLGIDWDSYREENPYFLQEDLEQEWSAAIARPDLVFSDTGIKVLEANIGSALGGVVQCDLLRSFWEERPELAFSASEPKVMDGIARFMLEFSHAMGVAPRAAILGLPEYYDPGMRGSYRFEADALRGHGIEAEAVNPDQLVGHLDAKSGSPWPIALRRNRPARWDKSILGSRPLQRLVKRGCHVLCPQSSFLMADKRLLAFVSAGLVPLDENEQRFVGRYLPWTRLIRPGPVEYEGDVRPMEQLLLLRQGAFVLKRGSSRGGIEVILGREQTPSGWESSVRAALYDGDWVVQEFQEVMPAVLPVAAENGGAGSREFTVVLSPFVVLGRAYGCVTRSLTTQGSAVVSTTAGAMANVALPSVKT
jgi:hypothetical protein